MNCSLAHIIFVLQCSSYFILSVTPRDYSPNITTYMASNLYQQYWLYLCCHSHYKRRYRGCATATAISHRMATVSHRIPTVPKVSQSFPTHPTLSRLRHSTDLLIPRYPVAFRGIPLIWRFTVSHRPVVPLALYVQGLVSPLSLPSPLSTYLTHKNTKLLGNQFTVPIARRELLSLYLVNS